MDGIARVALLAGVIGSVSGTGCYGAI